MNKLTIERQNGNVPKTLPGEDHVSGLLAYVPTADIPEAFKGGVVLPISLLENAEALGITSAAKAWTIRVLHHNLSELLRVNPAATLYVGVFAKSDSPTFTEVATMQNAVSGRIRQLGIWAGDTAPTADNLTKLQGVADKLDTEGAPLSILYAPKVAAIASLPTDLAGGNKSRVSVVIAQAGSGDGAALYTDAANKSAKNSVTAIGVALGLLSRAKVHQSISWVNQFPTGVSTPAFGDGTLLRNTDRAQLEALDAARYLFFITHVGVADSYFNDSHTMDKAISDYAAIESVRTMDKAVRGVRSYLTPELGSNAYIDPATGKLQSYSVSHLEGVANKALEDMERAGELSGYKAEINPDQDILSGRDLEVAIKQVAVGMLRKIKVKIGFSKSV